MATLKDEILQLLTQQNLSAIDITRQLRKYTKQEIQRTLYHELKDYVEVSDKKGERPIWKLKTYINDITTTDLDKGLSIKYDKDEERFCKHITDNPPYLLHNLQKNTKQFVKYDQQSDPTLRHKIIAIDIDNCQNLIPEINTYLQQDKNSIAKGYYSSGTSLKFKPIFEVEKIMTGVKDAADCHIMHWISRISFQKDSSYIFVLVSKDHILINTKNILISEGFLAFYCDDLETLREVLYLQ